MAPASAAPRIPRRTVTTAAALGVLALPALAACGSAGGASGAAADTSLLKVAFPSDSENYDPHQPPYTVSRAVARQIADTLVDQDPETGEILPWLAESWEANEDSSQFTFHLREGVTFSDGTEFTATSVKNNFDRIIDLGALAYIGASHLRGYTGTEVVDPRTAVVSFDGPNAQFLQAATTQTLSMLADATLALTPEEVASGKVIGSGAYLLESYTPGKTITLTRREDYAWGSGAYTNQGAAAFEKIEISFIPDATTLAGAVSSGQVDFAFLLDTSTLASIEGTTLQVEKRATRGISFPLVPFLYREIFQDEAVRRAINPATDRAEIAERIYQGQVEPATGLLTAATPGSADLSEFLAYDLDAATTILEEGGWTVGADGIRVNAAGQRLSVAIQYVGGNTLYEQLFQLLQTQWKKAGIEFVLEPVTEAQSSEHGLYDAPYDLSTWTQGRADPDVLRVVYSSFYENQSFFFSTPLPEIDEALLALQSTTDPEERAAASETAQRLLLEGGYSFPLIDAISVSAASATLGPIVLDAENKPAFADLAPAS
ncbi:ABC transporter substrate-binding protein [Brachybacterium hainanense]|uniref:ABC transporter substrate-binding protein n=1 Tax=Brachybacterium hainanense TaxID=1541174 RepID=A0ABV6RG09_9MICO